jgi:flagellar assembly protein FliH
MSTSREFRAGLAGLDATVLQGVAPEPVEPIGFDVDLRRTAPEGRSRRGPVAIPTGTGWRSPTVADLAVGVREAARAEGYSAGWSEGRRMAAAEARSRAAVVATEAAAAEQSRQQRHDTALVALATAATALENRAVPVLEDFSESILAAAFVLAEAVIGRELALTVNGGAEAMKRALDMAPRQRPVTVRLHPEDLATLAVHDTTVEIDGRTVTLVPDVSLDRGDAVAVCDATEVDARLAAALDRAGKALLG